MSDINDNYARNGLPEFDKQELLNRKKCELRENLNQFFGTCFTGMTQKDIDYEIINMFENCVESQKSVIYNLYVKDNRKYGVD